MKTIKYALPAIVIGFAVSASPGALAQTSLTLQVSDPSNAVWDLSEVPQLQHITFDVEKNSGPGVQVDYDDPFSQTGAGKLKGAGSTELAMAYRKEVSGPWIQVTPFAATYGVNGSITSTKGKGTVTFSSSAQGKGFVEGKLRNISISINYTMNIQATAGTLTGRSSTRAAAAGYGTLTDHGTFGPEAIPPELGNGAWTLALNLNDPVRNKISGQATVTLSTGAVFPFKVSGKYTPGTLTSKLSLTGIESGKGSTLQVTVVNATVKRVSGTISGQRVSVTQ